MNKHTKRGLEELGVKEFIDGKFFDGELYIDIGKKSYAALNFRKYNCISIIPTLIAKVARQAYNRSKSMGLGGNMEGDSFQTGGLLVVAAKGEKVLFEFHQNNPADHAQNEDILKALGLDVTKITRAAEGNSGMECSEDVCAMPNK